MQYTFVGTVDSAAWSFSQWTVVDGTAVDSKYGGSTKSAQGVVIGASVEYVFFVDRAKSGYYIDDAGLRTIEPDKTGTMDLGDGSSVRYQVDSYFTQLESSPLLTDLSTSSSLYFMGSDNYYYYFDNATSDIFLEGAGVMLLGGTMTHFTQVSNEMSSIDQWHVGTEIDGYEYTYFKGYIDSEVFQAQSAVVGSRLRLVSIEAVPEPATWLLLLVGIITLPLLMLVSKRSVAAAA